MIRSKARSRALLGFHTLARIVQSTQQCPGTCVSRKQVPRHCRSGDFLRRLTEGAKNTSRCLTAQYRRCTACPARTKKERYDPFGSSVLFSCTATNENPLPYLGRGIFISARKQKRRGPPHPDDAQSPCAHDTHRKGLVGKHFAPRNRRTSLRKALESILSGFRLCSIPYPAHSAKSGLRLACDFKLFENIFDVFN